MVLAEKKITDWRTAYTHTLTSVSKQWHLEHSCNNIEGKGKG